MINNSTILNHLYLKASESLIEHQLAAVIIQSNKMISKSYCNSPRNIIKGMNVGSLHAEARAILNYFGKSYYFDKNKNLIYLSEEYKKKKRKIDLVVVRINKNGSTCNARPCYNCLNMMKCVGIRKVYYSISSTEIICENVKDMISIQASSITRCLDLKYTKYELLNNNQINKYYENLLIKNFPLTIKKYNLDQFIQYNLNLILPEFEVKIFELKNKSYVSIFNTNNVKIVEAEIIFV
jgi:deoxycytidylate deaminase